MKWLLLIILPFCFAHAKWSDKSINLIQESSKEYKVKGPSGFVSLWGGIKRKFSTFKSYYPTTSFSLPDQFEKSISIYLKTRKHKSPLTIYFPGIFGSIEKDLTPAILNILEKNNTHIAVIPNFLSKRYIAKKPKYENGVSEQAIQSSVEIIQKIIEKLSKEKISKINLVGESLGTFVATATLSKLGKRNKDLKFDLMLLWPPLKIDRVVKNFDAKFLKTKKTYNQCNFLYQYMLSAYYFFWNEKPINPPKDFVTCMDSFLYHGTFGDSIKKNLSFKSDIYLEKDTKSPNSLEEFFYLFDKRMHKRIKESQTDLALDYWLEKRPIGSNVRIISSRDDFLNKGISWSELLNKSRLNNKNLILMNWGGHCAGLAMPVWDKIFNLELIN